MMMKNRWILAGLLLLRSAAWAGTDSTVRFGIGTEVLVSPGFHSFLNDTYSDVSGGYGWYGVRASLPCKLNDQWIIQPQITGYFNVMTVKGGFDGDSTSTNAMGLPAVVLRFFPYQKGILEWSVNGELNKPIAGSDLPGASFQGGALGTGISTGLRFWKRLNIELGYLYAPVKVTTDSSSLQGPGSKTYNFGGVSFYAGVEF